MTHKPYPSAANLSESYRQLEGFTEPELVYRADFSTADLKMLTTADVLSAAKQRSGDSLSDVFITLGVIFGLLLASSMALGLVASQLPFVVEQLTSYRSEAKSANLIRNTAF